MIKEFTSTRFVREGDIVFREGDPPGALYIVEAGIVEISRGEGGEKVVLAERKAGDVFGEMALVDYQPRSATARAVTDVHLHEVSEAVFSAYIKELNPLIHHVFKSLVTSIREMNETQTLIANILHLRGRSS
jgi:CRP-like cAMP-binding protein